jgi:hypothetical protein
MKETCYRYTATPSEFHQAWFLRAPWLPAAKGDICESYWPIEKDGRSPKEGVFNIDIQKADICDLSGKGGTCGVYRM